MKRIVFLVSVCLLLSCEKKNCEDTLPVEIEYNSPIVEGWDLHLTTLQSSGYLYRWYGPNGWKQEYETYSSDANLQTRPAVTAKDAGEYKVQLLNSEGCVVYEGTKTIDVIAAPPAPCALTPNRCTSSIAGVISPNLNHRQFQGSGNIYTVTAKESTSPGLPFMRFAFQGEKLPLPGVYTTDPTTFAGEATTVGLYIEAITYQFYAQPGQKVYVTKENGKLAISFCSIRFGNPLNPSNPIIISAKVTEP